MYQTQTAKNLRSVVLKGRTPHGYLGSATCVGTSSSAKLMRITFRMTLTCVASTIKFLTTTMPLTWFWMLIFLRVSLSFFYPYDYYYYVFFHGIKVWSFSFFFSRWEVYRWAEWIGGVSCRDAIWDDSCSLHFDQQRPGFYGTLTLFCK